MKTCDFMYRSNGGKRIPGNKHSKLHIIDSNQRPCLSSIKHPNIKTIDKRRQIRTLTNCDVTMGINNLNFMVEAG